MKAHELLERGGLPDASYYFRGQAKAKWHLRPSLVRYAKDARLDQDATEKLERAAEREFRKLGRTYLAGVWIPEILSQLDRWTLMQHYGAPTRLLDWTGSIFVAAYFAVEREPDYDGAVWVVHPGTVIALTGWLRGQRLKKKYPDHNTVLTKPGAPPGPYFYTPENQTDRMAAQQTAFSYSPQVLADHDTLIANASRGHGIPALQKLIIPNGLKAEFLRQLRRMNVTARALFPGIDGLGRSVAELLRIRVAE